MKERIEEFLRRIIMHEFNGNITRYADEEFPDAELVRVHYEPKDSKVTLFVTKDGKEYKGSAQPAETELVA